MKEYYERRPRFQAVQLLPKNVKKIKKLLHRNLQDVGFSEDRCFINVYDRLEPVPFECWLVLESNGRRHLLSDYEFKERYEPAGKKKKHGPQS